MDNQFRQRLTSLTSWLVLILFVIVFFNMMETPRVPTESSERQILRSFHLVVGSLLLVFSFIRVYLWLYFPPQNVPTPALRAGVFIFFS